jgi:hypothetical protein
VSATEKCAERASANVPTAPILRGCSRSTNLGGMKFSLAIAIVSLALAFGAGAALVSCGSSGSNAKQGDGGANAGQAFNPGGSSGGGEGGSSQGLTITPPMPTVTVVSGQAVPTVQFKAMQGSQQVVAGWSIDQAQLGSFNGTGLFTPSGLIGGTGNVTATLGSQTGTTTVTVVLQTVEKGDPAYSAKGFDAGAGGYEGVGGDGPGGPPTTAEVTTLSGTPTADATASLLYPYSGTVWPQGLLAPLLQWNPGAHSFDSVYVDLKENSYEFKGYFAANATPFLNLPIPQGAWQAATTSNAGGSDTLTLTVIFGQGAAAYGPYTETWTIAQTTLQGTIYYNSYGTALVKNSDTSDSYGNQYGAGTLAIAPGATSPVLVAGINSVANPAPVAGQGAGQAANGSGCRVCHTVSANGKALVTQASNQNAQDYTNTVYIDLANDTTGGAGTSLQTRSLAFPALYKDGSLLFSGSGAMIVGDNSSKLYATPGGTPVAGVTGFTGSFQGDVPAFSPDGEHVSFNFYGGSLTSDAGATLQSDQRSIGIIDFNGTTTFSNPRVLYTPTNNNPVVYSSFFPNSAGIVFEIELSNPSGSWGYTWMQNTSELWWVDVASGMAHRLDQLNGYGASGTPYLPDNAGGMATHTAAQDVTLNYEPTVGPIAGGGYAWVVFTSRRMYGGVAQLDPWTSDPRQYAWLDPGQITDKKLWVAAINLNATPGTDPSHPAFYLPAQELRAGNSRGYWSLQACQGDGQGCVTGTQCCGGYCSAEGYDAGLTCTSRVPPCSSEYEKCATTADCCGAGSGVSCINSVCTLAQAPP